MQKAPKSKPATNSAKVGPRQDHPSRPRTSFEEKWLEQITEDSCCLSNLDRHYRGKMRLRIQSSPDVKVLAHVKWFQRVGLLPQSPCMILGYGGRSRKNRAALERRWLHILDERQRDAWREWAGARFPETVFCATDRMDGGRAWTERMGWNRV
jgi:hypothetical protein